MAENVSVSTESLQIVSSPNKLTDELREKIIKLLEAGERPCSISRNHKINKHWVYRVNIEKRGFIMKNGKYIENTKKGIFNVGDRKNWLIEE